jgi:GNAT superfamily N-acetyltransferase
MPKIKPIPLWMRRENLENIPAHDPPENRRLRFYTPGDEDFWCQIQASADRGRVFDRNSFRSIFGDDPQLLQERQLFILDSLGQPIGTVTAWKDDYFQNPEWGRVHWLAVMPSWQARGLGKVLLTVCLRRLRELSYRAAYLKTWPTRLPAIRLYIQYGFVPWLNGPEEAKSWEALKIATNDALERPKLL